MTPMMMPKLMLDNDADDAPDTNDNDSGSIDSKNYPNSLRNHNHDPDVANYYAASPESLIDSKPKHKIDPTSMI